MPHTALLSAYQAALRAHDLDAVMACIADDAVYLFSTGASHIGKDAIRDAIAHNFSAIEAEDYRMEKLRWLNVSDRAAVCIFEYQWAGRIGGEPASGFGRGTIVMRCDEAGKWLIVHEHLSRGALGD